MPDTMPPPSDDGDTPEHTVETYVSDDQSQIGWRCLTCGEFEPFVADITSWGDVNEAADRHAFQRDA